MSSDRDPGEKIPSDALKVRLRAAELVSEISRRLLDVPADQMDRGFRDALRTVVTAIGFERGFVGTFSEAKDAFHVICRYGPAPATMPMIPGQPFPTQLAPWLATRILAGEDVVFRTSDLPPEADPERDLFSRRGSIGGANFPMIAGGQVFGCVGFVGSGTWDEDEVRNLRVIAQIFASALDRKETDERLRQKLALSDLISKVSRRFVELPAAELGTGIDQALRTIADFCGSTRALVAELADDFSWVTITHRYVAQGITPIFPLNTEISMDRLRLVTSNLETRRPIALNRDELPETARGEREIMDAGNVSHIIACPLTVGDRMLGNVVLDVPRKEDREFIDGLAVMGELFASAIERKRADLVLKERLRFEEAMSEASARLLDITAETSDAVFGESLGIIGRALEFDRVSLFELTGGRRYFSLAHEWCADGVRSFKKSMSGLTIDDFGWPMTELREGRSLAFTPDQVPDHALSCKRVLATDGTRLMITVPLIVGSDVVGCIAFYRLKSSRGFSEEQHGRLRFVGGMFAGSLVRRSAERSLQRSETRFTQVVASALDGFAMVNEAGVILEWTGQAERILGFRRGEVLGTSLRDTLFHPRARTRWAETMTEVFRQSRDINDGRFEIHARHREGGEIAIELSISALESSESPIYAVFIRDIAGRKHIEQLKQKAFEEVSRQRTELEGERDYLREVLQAEHPADGFVGRSPAILKVLDLVTSVATTSAAVLVHGESGAGKELIARAIHARSQRRDGPLVKVNCASIPKELFESEFFGHVRGAFTGAHKDRIGRFELASRGTLFLDEVGEIPLDLQAKLLRVLQESEFERVGDDRTRTADVRVIAATNRDLDVEAANGRFRKDLYYRLSVFPIEVPPLRNRREDVVPLARHFLERHAKKLARSELDISNVDAATLEAYDWPGNVRELEHVIERAVILTKEPPLKLSEALHTPSAPARARSGETPVMSDSEIRALERGNTLQALELSGWRISGPGGAAELLGISPSTLRDRMRVFDIQKPKSA